MNIYDKLIVFILLINLILYIEKKKQTYCSVYLMLLCKYLIILIDLFDTILKGWVQQLSYFLLCL